MKKILVAIMTAIIFYALIDLLLWGRMFEGKYGPEETARLSLAYFRGYHLVLISNIVIGSLLLISTGSIHKISFYATTMYVFGSNGTEDIIYFLLDGRNIPANLEWLNTSTFIFPFLKPVTNESLILNVIIWLIAWSIFWIGIWRKYPQKIKNEKLTLPKS